MKTNISFFYLLLFLSGFTVQAQELPGVKDSIFSDVLQENRHVQVVVPNSYTAGSEEKFGVIYLLDGFGNIRLTNSCLSFIRNEGYMPPMITVAIFNVDRNRDFLPSKNSSVPTSGGADKFLSFFKDELIPYINENYPSNNENILYGHSFGGVFSMYALLSEPQAFDTYIAVDPSFWWDDGYMQNLAVEKLALLEGQKKVLFISGREGGAYKGMGISKMDSILEAQKPKDLYWKSVAYPDESHGSVRYKSIYDGLKFTYEDYRSNIQFHPMSGIIAKGKPITILNMSDHKNVRFTVDGSEPTSESTKMDSLITLTDGGRLRVKAFSKRGSSSKEKDAYYKSGEVLAAQKKLKRMEPGGLGYTYYEGKWDSLPDFNTLIPVTSGTTSEEFTLNKLPKSMNFACLFEGHIEIQEEGYYIFAFDSDDGAKLYLDEQLLIDIDGLHGTGNSKSYVVPLEQGFYPLRMEYFQAEGGTGLNLVYVTPNTMQPKSIPFELQYHKKK